MTRDEIMRMAAEVEWEITGHDFPHSDEFIQWCERFAALVSAAEREECAKICESLAADRGMFHPDDEELKIGVLAGAGMCGATIRARGKK